MPFDPPRAPAARERTRAPAAQDPRHVMRAFLETLTRLAVRAHGARR